MAKLLVLSALLVCYFSLSLPAIDATAYTVGDRAGWDISADLGSWAASKIFYVGDSLLFQYNSYHSVNEVDDAGYDSCTVKAPLLASSNGNTTVPLTSPGDRFFVCGTELHCLGGMKLHVNVRVNQSAAGPAVGATPSPSAQAQPTAPPAAPSPLLQWDAGANNFPLPSGGGAGRAGRGSSSSCAFVACLCALGAVAWMFAPWI